MLNKDVRKIIIEAGLTASNHQLIAEANSIQAALPFLIENEQNRRIVAASMLIGLGEITSAQKILHGDLSDEAGILRRLIKQGHQEPCWERTVTPFNPFI